jgi:hypothetical protein
MMEDQLRYIVLPAHSTYLAYLLLTHKVAEVTTPLTVYCGPLFLMSQRILTISHAVLFRVACLIRFPISAMLFLVR